jgi:diaminohydroxyphosphoribosylaminopyrimidine deaminase/5-amino-6-(5-phosphoribosylamino)uracil reductase
LLRVRSSELERESAWLSAARPEVRKRNNAEHGWRMNQFETAMSAALELATRGPEFGGNPQVGAVLLDPSGTIAAEGWHEGAGTDHAEVMALRNLREKLSLGQDDRLPAGYTAVVTLEPCNHTGKTGPCADALIAAGVDRVVFAATDPGAVSGGGAEKLATAGVEVIEGILEEEANELIRIWRKSTELQRVFVTVKWASTLDGRTAANDGTSKWISGEEARFDVHMRRSKIDAIAVGTNTVVVDDPELTARTPDGTLYEHQPLRVIIGMRNLDGGKRVFSNTADALRFETHDLLQVTRDLYRLGHRHLWVEGGAELATAFIRANLADQLLIYLTPTLLGGSRLALKDLGIETIGDISRWQFDEVELLGEDLLITASPANRASQTEGEN